MANMIEFDVALPGGNLHCYEHGSGDLVVVWHHGTPNVGEPPAPLFDKAEQVGIRWLSFDRPGYGDSTPWPNRSVGSVSACVQAIADARGVERFALMGHSGGSSHAIAAGVALGARTRAVLSIAALAPYESPGLDWFAGMADSGIAGLTAAREGRAAKEQFEADAVDSMPAFTPADLAMFGGPWRWLGSVAGRAMAGGPGGLIDDDLAYVRPWGVDPAELTAPVLLVHGGADAIVPAAHSEWLASVCPRSELWRQPEDGHLSALRTAETALEWLVDHA